MIPKLGPIASWLLTDIAMTKLLTQPHFDHPRRSLPDSFDDDSTLFVSAKHPYQETLAGFLYLVRLLGSVLRTEVIRQKGMIQLYLSSIDFSDFRQVLTLMRIDFFYTTWVNSKTGKREYIIHMTADVFLRFVYILTNQTPR